MSNKATEHQAKVYVYDLNNCASEFGFKNDEGWQLTTVTDSRKKELEKQYYPTVSVKVLPETLAELFTMVKERALQLRAGFVHAIDNANTNKHEQELQYIVAYNLNRPLR